MAKNRRSKKKEEEILVDVVEAREAAQNFFEKNQREPWRVSDAPSAFTEKMIAAIVGLEVSIDRIEGKFKLGQNRSAEDRAGAISGLRAVGAGSLAEMMDHE